VRGQDHRTARLGRTQRVPQLMPCRGVQALHGRGSLLINKFWYSGSLAKVERGHLHVVPGLNPGPGHMHGGFRALEVDPWRTD
jgi:hypothetical protein